MLLIKMSEVSLIFIWWIGYYSLSKLFRKASGSTSWGVGTWPNTEEKPVNSNDWDSYPTTLLHCSVKIQQTSDQFADVSNATPEAETLEEGLLLGNHPLPPKTHSLKQVPALGNTERSVEVAVLTSEWVWLLKEFSVYPAWFTILITNVYIYFEKQWTEHLNAIWF